jgi:hypothetical protein
MWAIIVAVVVVVGAAFGLLKWRGSRKKEKGNKETYPFF